MSGRRRPGARALNPDIASLLQAAAEAGAPPLEALEPAAARSGYLENRSRLQPPLNPVPLVRDVETGPPGASIRLRVLRGVAGEAPLPCLLYMHGGGWMLGSIESHEGICRRIAVEAGCCVISVDYRLAPEHPFPAALEDAVRALRFVGDNAAALGIDPRRIAVGGDSAGGNLAAILALMGRDGEVSPSVFQLLLYPAVDLTLSTPTFETAAEGMLISARTIRWFVDHYIPDPATRADWRASPLFAPSLAGTPPAFVLTCGHDPLCEEGALYAARLESEGVAVTHVHLADQAHGILNMGKAVGAASGALAYAASALREGWRHAEGQGPAHVAPPRPLEEKDFA